MRVVWEPSELPEGLRMATAEAESSFGDTRMLLQQFVCPTDGRHIEIQVLADSHGAFSLAANHAALVLAVPRAAYDRLDSLTCVALCLAP